MHLKHLQYLVALAEERHFGRAASALMIRQSALSQAVQHLEKHFSTPIAVRDQSGFQGFTREGEAILSWARQSLAEIYKRSGRLGVLAGSISSGISERRTVRHVEYKSLTWSVLPNPPTDNQLTIGLVSLNRPDASRCRSPATTMC